ncbi:MAG: glycosyltransferase family 4 protein, partial [Deltaproteobacteria bacterium]|nr:glycosyltransferase family 4 protein [Deltaproteobacteria bacterium]
FKGLVLTSIRRADLINVPSRATRDALMEWVPDLSEEKVCVTEFGIASSFHATSPEQSLRETRRLGLPDAYILFVGNIEPRKNLKLLVETYRKLVVAGEISEHLVLAGRHDSAFQSLFEDVQTSELRGRVHLPGFIAEADLPWLYRGARLFVYPSLGEGFGFPPLEAMACAVPVISSLGSSLEENLDGAAELVPPQDLNALADAILRLLRDDVLREQRIRDGLRRAAAFRSEDSARKILRCYRELGRKSPRVV